MFRHSLWISLPGILLSLLFSQGRGAAEDTLAESTPAPLFLPVEIVDAAYGGSGCPQGTASVILAGNAVAILFDEYVVATSYGDSMDRKSCNYAIALRVLPGYTVSLTAIDYRGFADIPWGGSGRLYAEYFWAGQSGPVHTRAFPGGYLGDWIEIDFVSAGVWSACGGEVIARNNTSIFVRKSSPTSAQDAELAVDSLDMEAGIIYFFDWDAC